MSSPPPKTPEKPFAFGQTNSLSVPAKMTPKGIDIPSKQFGSDVKLPKDQSSIQVTPSKAPILSLSKVAADDNKDESFYTAKHVSLYKNEAGTWTKKAKNGSIHLSHIKRDSNEVVQVVFRDNSTLKRIMLNAALVRDAKVFRLPKQDNSVAFNLMIEKKIETIGLLFKEKTDASSFHTELSKLLS